MSHFRFALAALLAATVLPASAAVDPDDLLPVEEAFALRANATERGRVEFTWTIAEGYYLYKHRIAIQPVDSGFKFNPLELPAGEKKTDEFFGEVETYRGELRAVLTGAAASGTNVQTFNVRYQGCADVGVCYPPHQQKVTVALPPDAVQASGQIAAPPSPLPSPASGRGSLLPASVQGTTPTADNPLQRALGGSAAAPTTGVTDALPLPPEQAFGFEAIATSATELLLRFTPAPGYYLYRDRSSFRILDNAQVSAASPRWPKGQAHRDEHFGEVIVYFDQIEVPLPLRRSRPDAETIQFEATFQGCQTDGICYPPMIRAVEVALPRAEAAQLTAALPASTVGAAPQSEEDRLTRTLRDSSLLIVVLVFFLAGIGLAFTPCVYPMIPILSGIIAGAGENLTTHRAFVLSSVYVLASAVVFALAGVIAGLLGFNITAAFQNPWVLTGFALLFVALALSMFGFFELQLPSAWQAKLADLSNRQKAGSLPGVAVMGALSALIVGPCVTPPLAVAVGYIGQTGSPVLGGIALFTLALGMGAPLIAFGTTEGKLLPRAGAWMDAVKAVFGVLFLGLAIWMLERFLPPFWILLMTGALLIGCGVYLGGLERIAEGASGWRRLWKSLGLVLLLLGALELIGALGGGRDPLQPLRGVFALGRGETTQELTFAKIKSSADLDAAIAAANASNRPVLFDFYADWCVACKEMEKYTFTSPEVRAALKDHVLLKADVTANDDIDQALMKRFGIIGPPATLFFGRDGKELRDARLIGFEKAEDFVARVQGVAR